MLKSTKQSFYGKVKPFCHLGDIIAMVQWVHKLQVERPEAQFYMYSKEVCSCGCNRDAASQILRVLELMDTNVKLALYDNYPNSFIPPVCYFSGKLLTYAKASCLTKEVYNYVTAQLIPTGDHEWPSRRLDNIPVLLHSLRGEKVFNMGDAPVAGTIHFRGTIKEKLNLISGAKMHVTVDSGTAHLASMTDTPVLVIAPERYHNRYAAQTNVKQRVCVHYALPLIAKILKARAAKMCKFL